MFIKLDKEYEVKCTLGVIRDIEKGFNKAFYTLMGEIGKLTTSEQMKFLFYGFRKINPEISEQQFYALCEDNLGLGQLTDYLETYLYQLQYPGMSKEEIDQIMQKKLQAAGKTKGSTGTNL